MLKELPKVGQVVVAVQDEYEWESDRRYLTCCEKYVVIGQSEVSENPYIIDDLGDKCFIDDNAFHLYELKVDKEWDETQDTLILNELEFKDDKNYLEIHSNYSSWEESKKTEYPFYIGITETFDMLEASTQLSTEQAKQLRDYLTHKIEYLEEETN